MKPKTIIITLIVLAVIGYLLVLSYQKSASSTAAVQNAAPTGEKSALTSPEVFYDFGSISMKNGNVTKEFTFTNPTDKDINIRGLETSCMCTSALLVEPDGSTKGPFGMGGMGGMTTTDDTVKARESRTLRVIYDPNAHGPAGLGDIDRFITVTDSTGGTLRFEIKAVVTP